MEEVWSGKGYGSRKEAVPIKVFLIYSEIAFLDHHFEDFRIKDQQKVGNHGVFIGSHSVFIGNHGVFKSNHGVLIDLFNL